MPRPDTDDSNKADRRVDGEQLPERNNVSFTLSTPTSPHPRYTRQGISRANSAEGPDERSPLLQTSRSRLRIQSALDTTKAPHLPRNESYTGEYR